MCREHDHQNRLSPRLPRRRYTADTRMPVGPFRIDHEPRSHRLTAQLVRSPNPSTLHEEAATS
jgi:hypothetical protein